MNRWIQVYHHQEQSLVLPGAKSTSVGSNHLINLNTDGTEIDALDLYDIYMISIHPSLRVASRWIVDLTSVRIVPSRIEKLHLPRYNREIRAEFDGCWIQAD